VPYFLEIHVVAKRTFHLLNGLELPLTVDGMALVLQVMQYAVVHCFSGVRTISSQHAFENRSVCTFVLFYR
jgi:hypothetical protein